MGQFLRDGRDVAAGLCCDGPSALFSQYGLSEQVHENKTECEAELSGCWASLEEPREDSLAAEYGTASLPIWHQGGHEARGEGDFQTPGYNWAAATGCAHRPQLRPVPANHLVLFLAWGQGKNRSD